ncbi:MAG: hypothetical protein ABIF11_02480 [Nitrospirota bacterium]
MKEEVAEGTLGADFDRTDRAEIHSRIAEAEESAKDEIWGGYRFIVIADNRLNKDKAQTLKIGVEPVSVAKPFEPQAPLELVP